MKRWKSPYPGTAEFSPCGQYRRTLTRLIDASKPRTLVVIGLNPSTATADEDDPTIAKEIKYAISWGFGRLVKENAYDYCASKPREMWRAHKAGTTIVTTYNVPAIRRSIPLTTHHGMLLLGWGRGIDLAWQAELAVEFSHTIAFCLGTNQNGTPVHPLYQPDAAQPIPWECP